MHTTEAIDCEQQQQPPSSPLLHGSTTPPKLTAAVSSTSSPPKPLPSPFSIASQQQPAGEQHAAVKPTALLRPLTPAHADQACSAVLGHQGHRGTVPVDDLR